MSPLYSGRHGSINIGKTAKNWGLKSQVYDTDAVFDPAGTKTQWQRFENKVASLNAASPIGTQYKLIFFGRHGEGYHNAAETFYGTPAWNVCNAPLITYQRLITYSATGLS